jgi:hypothetical protein
MAGGGANVEDLIRRIRTSNLPAQIGGAQTKVTAMGGKPKKGGPSFISRIFDVIQRPLYGISEGVARASEHAGPKNPRKGKGATGDILGGILGGLAGKQKTHGSDVLQRAAEADPTSLLSPAIRSNKFGIKSAAGFVWDIGADPVTYMSGGINKLGKAEEVLAKTSKLAETVADGKKVGGEIRAVRKVAGEAAAKAEPMKLAQSGEHITPELAKKAVGKAKTAGADAASAEFVTEAAEKTLNKAFDPARRLELKFMGKKVASIPVQKAFVPLDKAVASKAGQAIGKKLSSKMLYAEKTRDFLRKHSSVGVAQFERTAREVRRLFKDLTPEELTSISHALEGDAEHLAKMGLPASSIKVGHEGTITVGKDVLDLGGNYNTLDDYRKAAKGFFDHIHDGEEFRGIVKGESKANNYVYHHYETKDAKLRNSFKNSRKASMKEGTLGKTLRDAEAKGLKPVTSVDELMVRRAGKSYARVSQADITHAIINEYKITTKDKDIIAAFKSEGVPIAKVQGGERSFRHGEGALNQLRNATDASGKKILSSADEVFLPQHIFDSIKHIDELHKNAGKADELFKMLDKVQQPWKFWATAANPGHHIRNAVGDTYLNFLDGVVDPRHYSNATRLIWGKNPENFTMKIGGRIFNGKEILKLYEDAGAKSGFFRAEYGKSLEKGLKKFKGSKEWIVNKAEMREDTGRLAHFIHAMKDEAAKSGKTLQPSTKHLEDIADKAAARVRKWNIDYGDLTPFETDYMKRIIPFYTWMRKNIPLQLEAIAMRPGRVGVVPKFNNAIEAALGTENNFENAVIPKWMKEMGAVSLVGEGEGKNALYWAPNLPIQDVTRFLEGGKEGILREIMSTTSPALRIPYEQAFGESLFSGAPIKGQGQYAAQQIPMANEIYGLLKKGGGAGEPSVGGRRLKMDQLINYLTGIGVQNVGERERASELRRQEDIAQFQVKDLRNKIRRKALGGK